MQSAGVGTGVESARLVAALEHAVRALELLATLPTPETCGSFAAFLHQAHDDDGHKRRLAVDVEATLAAHFRIEVSLAQHAAERQQRRAGAHDVPKQSDASRPEADEENEQEEDEEKAQPKVEIDEDEDAEWDHDDALRFPRILHTVLQLLTHDKATRDTLRHLSATRISPDAAALVHGLTDLVILCERSLATTPEQDERQRHTLRDATLHLVELHDDAAQLRFELAAEREARQTHALTHVQTIAHVREQLRETERHARDTLVATQRTRDLDAQQLRTQVDADHMRVHEQQLALVRSDARLFDAHDADENDGRKRVARDVATRNDLVAKYDRDMTALDDAMADVLDEIEAQESDFGRLATYFERVDEDRHYALDEQRARDAEDARRRRRDLNLFKLTTRLQALVRGFLTRRRVRLDEQNKKRKKKKKKTKSTIKTTKPMRR